MKSKTIANSLFLSILAFIVITLCIPLFAQEDDDHFIQDDEYFVSAEKFTLPWKYVYLAKMMAPATKETKNEARFMMVASGEELWTKFYFKSRKLAESEIKVGLEVIILEAGDDEGVYRAPENKDEARSNNWFMAKITDVSDKYKGYITVSGGYKVRLNNMRVIVK